MLQPILNTKLNDIGLLCKRHKVSELYAFGSVCTDRFTDESDIDMLVSFYRNQISLEDFADNYFDLIDELEKLLGKEVDLVSENSLRNKYFISTISKTKTPLYAG